MGRSIDYMKTKEPFQDYFLEGATMQEENLIDFLQNLLEKNKELLNYDLDGGVYSWWINEDLILRAKFAPKAEFESYFVESVKCDGTYLFFAEVVNRVVGNMLAGYIPKGYQNCFVENVPMEITYYIGKAVLVEEHGDFGTEEKPWMKRRFTAFLPYKVDVKPQKRKLIV